MRANDYFLLGALLLPFMQSKIEQNKTIKPNPRKIKQTKKEKERKERYEVGPQVWLDWTWEWENLQKGKRHQERQWEG